MKRYISILLTIMLGITLIACSNQPTAQPNSANSKSGTAETLKNPQTGDNAETAKGDNTVTSSKTTTSSASDDKVTNTAPKTTQSKPPVSAQTSSRSTTTSSSKGSTSTSSKTSGLKPPVTSQTSSKTTTSSSQASSKPANGLVAPPMKPFNIDAWVEYAKQVAVSKGLKLSDDAIYCWEGHISAKPTSKYLEMNINDRMSRYANVDHYTYVWVWYKCSVCYERNMDENEDRWDDPWFDPLDFECTCDKPESFYIFVGYA